MIVLFGFLKFCNLPLKRFVELICFLNLLIQ
jgi:hypothetical protein